MSASIIKSHVYLYIRGLSGNTAAMTASIFYVTWLDTSISCGSFGAVIAEVNNRGRQCKVGSIHERYSSCQKMSQLGQVIAVWVWASCSTTLSPRYPAGSWGWFSLSSTATESLSQRLEGPGDRGILLLSCCVIRVCLHAHQLSLGCSIWFVLLPRPPHLPSRLPCRFEGMQLGSQVLGDRSWAAWPFYFSASFTLQERGWAFCSGLLWVWKQGTSTNSWAQSTPLICSPLLPA